MIEVSFEGINHLDQEETNERNDRSSTDCGCACCICAPNVAGAGSSTADIS